MAVLIWDVVILFTPLPTTYCWYLLLQEAAPFAGSMRYDARIAVQKALEDMGLLRGKEDNNMRLGICSR